MAKKSKPKPPKRYRNEGRLMIARVHQFLKEEYNFINENNHDFCDLNILSCVIKRTVSAVGVSDSTVRKIINEKRKKIQIAGRTIIGDESREIIIGLYHFLQEEYNWLKENNHESCDFSLLANIIKRTANATGVSERDITAILENEQDQFILNERRKTDINYEDEVILVPDIKTEVEEKDPLSLDEYE